MGRSHLHHQSEIERLKDRNAGPECCPVCKGSGVIRGRDKRGKYVVPCPVCEGTGWVTDDTRGCGLKKYVCLSCGWIVVEKDSKPEDQVRCPKCGHEVTFWKQLEDEVDSRR